MVFDGIQGVNSNLDALQNARQAATVQEKEKVKEQFLAVFYKELLKKVYKAPNLSLGGEEENNSNSTLSTFTSDLLVEKMAMELAKNQILNFNPEGAVETR
jgi:Rod binding domain-containing protein